MPNIGADATTKTMRTMTATKPGSGTGQVWRGRIGGHAPRPDEHPHHPDLAVAIDGLLRQARMVSPDDCQGVGWGATWDDAAEALLQHHEGKLAIERSQH
jgi:hypothetical protein